MASKQYLLLPLLTPGHGSLLVLCKPVQRQAQVEAPGTKDTELESVLRQMGVHQPWLLLHFDSLSGAKPFCASLLASLSSCLRTGVGGLFPARLAGVLARANKASNLQRNALRTCCSSTSSCHCFTDR